MNLNQEIQALGIQWDVAVNYSHKETTCRCISAGQTHKVIIDRYTQENPTERKSHVIHELCHCSLAETIDPCFSFLMAGHKEDPNQTLQKIYLGWCPIDIWVNKLRHQHFPEMTKQEIDTTLREVSLLANNPSVLANSIPLIIGIAMMKVENRYYNCGLGVRKVIKSLPHYIGDMVKVLEPIMEKMINTKPTVRMLEKYTNKYLKALHISNQIKFVFNDKEKMHVITWQ